MEMRKKAEICSSTPVHRWMASAWQELFRRFDNLVVGVRSSLRPRLKRIPCPRALMVVRGSGPSHCGALAAQAQVRVIPILGLDRLPLRRRRSHQFDHPTRQLTFLPFPAASAYAMAEASWRNVSPRLITAHAILAILLATAIVTTRGGRLWRSALIQPASSGLLRQ